MNRNRDVQEDRLQLALKSSDAGTWELDLKSKEEFWDENLCQLCGLDPEDQPIDVEKFRQLVHPDDRDKMTVQQELNATSQLQHEIRIQTENGYRWFQVRGRVFYDDQGEPERVLGVSIDITEQKEIRRDLTLFRETLDHSPDLTFIIDPETGTIQDVTGKTTENVGYCPDELTNMSVDQIDTRVGDEIDWQELIGRVAQQDVYTFESEHLRKDGSTFPVQIRAVHIERDEINRMVSTARDITEHKQLRQNLEEKTTYLTNVLNATPNLIAVKNSKLEIELVNDAMAEFYGRPREELLDQKFSDLVSDEHAKQVEKNQQQVLKNGKPGNVQDLKLKSPATGNQRWFQIRYIPLYPDSPLEQRKLLSIGTDITERKQTERQLKQAESRFRQMAQNIDSVFYLSTQENEILYVSPAFEEIWGRPSTDVFEGTDLSRFFKCIHPDDRDRIREAVSNRTPSDNYDQKYRIIRPDGEIRWIRDQSFPVTNKDGHPKRFAGLAQDITDRVQLEQKLKNQALYDQLTELPNRSLFEDRLKMAINRCERNENWPFAVLFMDLDQFKEINDTYGHSFGDELLQQLGTRLQSTLRTEDTIARFGGDEFTILLEGVGGKEDVQKVIKRIQSAWQNSFHVRDRNVNVTASIGVVMATENRHNIENLLRDADTAMFRAKRDSSSKVQFYTEEIRIERAQYRSLKTELSEAFENNEFEVHYQPIFNLSNQKMVGLEALLHWRHPERGLLSPDEFLSQALESNLLPDIEFHIVQRVISFIHSHYDQFESGPLEWVSVNLSSQYFLQSGAVQQILDELDHSGIDSRHLRPELTENTAVEKEQITQDNLDKMKQNGLLLAIDGYGTGYSSLKHLQMLPIDLLKMDRALIKDSTKDSDHEILRSAIRLAEIMDLTSIAEGVETQAQFELVKELGCEYAQGRYFDSVLPGPQIRERIAENM